MLSTVAPNQSTMSREAFALLGTESVAYVRAIRSEEVGFVHAEAPLLLPGHLVYVLHAADGSPLVISESLDAVMADAAEHRLETVSLH